MLFCYFVSALPPPRAPCQPEVCLFPLRACVAGVDLSFFFPSFPFFDFDLDIVCFMLSFSCGYYAISSVSVSAATRLAYDILRSVYMYLDTYVSYADLTFVFLSEVQL